MIELLKGATSVVDGATFRIEDSFRGQYGRVVQVVITGTATVGVYGRLDPSLPWVLIKESTASEAYESVVFPEMRASVTARSSGSISVYLDAGLE